MMHQPIWPTKPPKRPGKGGVRVWMIGTDTAKDQILTTRLRIVDPESGKPIGAKAMHFPEGTPETYFDGLTSEVKKPHSIAGRTVWRWTKLSGRQNEPLDLEVLCLAGLRALGRSVYDHLEREVAKVRGLAAAARGTTPAIATPQELADNTAPYQKERLAKRRRAPTRRTWMNAWRKW